MEMDFGCAKRLWIEMVGAVEVKYWRWLEQRRLLIVEVLHQQCSAVQVEDCWCRGFMKVGPFGLLWWGLYGVA